MGVVRISGSYMTSDVKTTSFDGKEKSAVYIDIYQPDSPLQKKLIQVKADDVSLINTLNKDYDMGSSFSCLASVSAYKNQEYYKFISF